MARSVRPLLMGAFYCCNFGVFTCLFGAAYFLSQGLFGDLYSCNERTEGSVERVYDSPQWRATWNFCLVDLNYTAVLDGTTDEQSFYALQVTLPCDRIQPGTGEDPGSTGLCYNHYHPEYFSSISKEEQLTSKYSHEEAVRDVHLGVRAALWMALFGFLSSCIHRNMDGLDRGGLRLQETGLRWMEQAKSKLEKWRARRREERTAAVPSESALQDVGGGRGGAELHTISREEQGHA